MFNIGFNESGYMYPSNMKGKTNKQLERFTGTFKLTYTKDRKGVSRFYLEDVVDGLKYIIKEDLVVDLFKKGKLNNNDATFLELRIVGTNNSRWCIINEYSC